MNSTRTVAAGLAGGTAGNAILGLAFSSPPLQALLYDPALQSALFIEVTRGRDIPVSVAGLVVLSIAHAWLYGVLEPSIPGAGRLGKGLFWGFAIWLMYWVFQEWFIDRTLLHEPWRLVAVELVVLLAGSLVEGIVIASLMPRRTPP